jgi:hypothetical protein
MPNDLPADYEKLREWFPVIRRMMRVMTVGNNQMVKTTVICDRYGKPVFWGEPEWTQLEPRSREMKVSD